MAVLLQREDEVLYKENILLYSEVLGYQLKK